MASVRFEVHHHFTTAPRAVWDELVDWAGHADWVPATRVEVAADDPTAVGASFTAYTGFGPLTLEDRMEVVRCNWSDEESSGECEVSKVGPVLGGAATFTVSPAGDGATVHWVEDITVPHVPQFAAPLAGKVGALGFGHAMRRLSKRLNRRATAAT